MRRSWRLVVCLSAHWLWTQQLLPAQSPNPEQAFADVFAAVLTGENPDGGNWQAPGVYLGAAAARALPSQPDIARILGQDLHRYRVLVVPGFFSACASSGVMPAPVFDAAREHLQVRHGVDVALLQVPNDSCENNGKLIAKYLFQHAADGRKYIVIGHSKGAADLQLALQEPAAAAMVAAFVSVAGAVRGSGLADTAAGIVLVGKLTESFGCVGRLGPALQSLRSEERRAFVAAHPTPPVPSYSLVAASSLANTSRSLRASWLLLGAGLQPEDGMLIAADGVLPGGQFLGTALADHVSVVQDFQKTALAGLSIPYIFLVASDSLERSTASEAADCIW